MQLRNYNPMNDSCGEILCVYGSGRIEKGVDVECKCAKPKFIKASLFSSA